MVTRHTARLPHCYWYGEVVRPVTELLQVWRHVVPLCFRTDTGVVTRHTALLLHCYWCGDVIRPVTALLQV